MCAHLCKNRTRYIRLHSHFCARLYDVAIIMRLIWFNYKFSMSSLWNFELFFCGFVLVCRCFLKGKFWVFGFLYWNKKKNVYGTETITQSHKVKLLGKWNISSNSCLFKLIFSDFTRFEFNDIIRRPAGRLFFLFCSFKTSRILILFNIFSLKLYIIISYTFCSLVE